MKRKKLKNFKNYEIDKNGNIFAYKRLRDFKTGYYYKWIKLNPSNVFGGYSQISIFNNISGKYKTYFVHRLVALTFIPNPKNKPQVNHIDGNKHNNCVENLEWVTASENMKHAHKIGLQPSTAGELNSMSKITNKKAINLIRDILNGKTNEEVALKYDLHPRYVSLVRHKKRWKSIWDNFYRDQNTLKSAKQVDRSKIDYQSYKINRSDQLEILDLIVNKKLLLKDIAKKYKLDPSHLSRISRKQTWKNVWRMFELNAQRLSKTTTI